MPNDNTARAREARELAKWCMGVTSYLRRLGSDPTLTEFDQIVEVALKARSVRQLKSIKRDLSEWARSLTPAQQKEMEEWVRTHMGADPASSTESLEDAVREILKRGSIHTEAEYRLLSEWMDRILDDPSNEAEVEQVDRLLTQFGTRLKRDSG